MKCSSGRAVRGLVELYGVVCTCLLLGGVTPTHAEDDPLERSVHALEANDLPDAELALAQLSEGDAKSPDATFQRGLVEFYAGRYDGAVAAMERAIANAPRSPQLGEWRRLLQWATAARDITRDFAEAHSSDGRYVIRYQKGADAVLVPYALDALRDADHAIEAQLGIKLPAPIRLEVYPSARTLADVSSLSIEHI
ncbi:MAG: hypothetical protein RLZZ450_7419, partial [Pseudomonadota bacterium]